MFGGRARRREKNSDDEGLWWEVTKGQIIHDALYAAILLYTPNILHLEIHDAKGDQPLVWLHVLTEAVRRITRGCVQRFENLKRLDIHGPGGRTGGKELRLVQYLPLFGLPCLVELQIRSICEREVPSTGLNNPWSVLDQLPSIRELSIRLPSTIHTDILVRLVGACCALKNQVYPLTLLRTI